jgi:hypothetical protein
MAIVLDLLTLYDKHTITKNILRQTERQAEGRTDRWKDGRTEVKQYTPFRWSGGIRIPPPVERGYNKAKNRILLLYSKCNDCRMESYIWSQSSYWYVISWEAFLDPSDSYFLFADLVGFYAH